jgi:adenine phosphoribosyltransferase
MTADEIKKLTRGIPDFPQPAILFRDITTLISDAHGISSDSRSGCRRSGC